MGISWNKLWNKNPRLHYNYTLERGGFFLFVQSRAYTAVCPWVPCSDYTADFTIDIPQCLSLVKEHRATSPENAGNLDQVKTDALQLRALISVVLMEVEEKCDSQTLDQVRSPFSYLNIYTVKIITRCFLRAKAIFYWRRES